MQQLFIKPEVTFEPLEKTAAEVDLPEDPNSWPTMVMQELYKQVPYVSDFEPRVAMNKVDGERGYALGQVEITNQTDAPPGSPPEAMQAAGIRTVRIPIIIKERKLQPFDLLLNDTGTVLPLTEARLRQAMFRPQMFDVTSQTPGDASLIGQLYPPYRMNYGMGGGGMGYSAGGAKMAEALDAAFFGEEKEASTAGAWLKRGKELPTELTELVRGQPASRLRETIAKPGGSTAQTRLKDLAQHELDFAERAHAMKKASVELRETDSLMKEALSTFSQADVDSFFGKIAGDQHLQAAVTRNFGSMESSINLLANYRPEGEKRASAMLGTIAPSVMQLTRHAGGYQVKTANVNAWAPKSALLDRGELVRTFGVKVAMDVDTKGSVTIAPEGVKEDEAPEEKNTAQPISRAGLYKVWQDGDEAKELLGVAIPNLLGWDGKPVPLTLFTNGSVSALQAEIVGTPVGGVTTLPKSEPRGTGIFFTLSAEGELTATLPLTVQHSVEMPGEDATFTATTVDGQMLEFSKQAVKVMLTTPEGKVLIPAHWQWSPLGASAIVPLLGGPDEEAAAPEKTAQLVVRAQSRDCVSLGGPAVEKLANAEREGLGLDDALFLLAGLGVDTTYGATKIAQSLVTQAPVPLAVHSVVTPMHELLGRAAEKTASLRAAVAPLRKDLLKEAAFIPDPNTVDTILSLGFINPENAMMFASFLPTVEKAQLKLAEMLLGVRMGLPNIPVFALERAIRATEEVIVGLKTLAFQGV